jgi:hypothetical protein
MLKGFGVLTGIALSVAALSGCDDRNDAKQTEKGDTQADAVPSPARLGAGWRAVADSRLSPWSFARNIEPDAPAGRADALAGIRTALMANMLPARNSVRIEALVNRALSSIGPSGSSDAQSRPMIVLTTTPWNDDTLLLWVEVPGLTAAGGTAIGVEFDPAAVAAFRTLGDPAAIPSPAAASGRAAMLYELQPQKTGSSKADPKSTVKYAVLHVAGPGDAKIDQPITNADTVGTVDNAPDVVRFATAAAGFGGLLRGDPAMRDLSCNDVIALAQSIRLPDPDGWRAQLIALMYRAQPLIDLPPAR